MAGLSISSLIPTWVKQVLFGAGLVAIISLNFISYHMGQQNERESQQKTYTSGLEDLIKKYGDNQTLLQALAQGQQLTLQEIRSKQTKTKEDVNNYGKNPNADNRCLDDEWVRIYNESLPSGDRSSSGGKVDGKSGKDKTTSK